MSDDKYKSKPSAKRGYQPKKKIQEGYRFPSDKPKPPPPSGTSVVKKKSK